METIEQLRIRLRGKDPDARLEAAVALAKLGQMEGLEPVFAKLLKQKNPDLRGESAYQLGMIGPGWSVDLLGPLVQDEEGEVRHDAIVALMDTCRVQAISWVARSLFSDDPETREDGRVALVSILGNRAAQATSYLLDPPQEYERFSKWWEQHQAQYDPQLCYSKGEIASIERWIEALRGATPALAGWLNTRLRFWTGVDSGTEDGEAGYVFWEQWYRENGRAFLPGKRYFYGHLID